MPLPNNAETAWIGYLIDGIEPEDERYLQELQKILQARDLPKVTMKRPNLNMWWRPDAKCIDLVSKIDGDVECTVHAMPYGTSLFIGFAFRAVSSLGNYYKRMAAIAFLETIDRCALEAVDVLRQGKAVEIKPVGQKFAKSGDA